MRDYGAVSFESIRFAPRSAVRVAVAACLSCVAPLAAATALPSLDCMAEQTGGFHDHPDDAEPYVPVLFHPVPFRLEVNPVFMLNLQARTDVDLFLTLTAVPAEGGEQTAELECRSVRGSDGSPGYSCVNIPPAEMLLINRDSLRFTRAAVGGWTFAGATESLPGDSLYIEYGACRPIDAPAPAHDPAGAETAQPGPPSR